MTNADPIYVDSIEDHYDEESLGIVMDLNHRVGFIIRCRHEFINAILQVNRVEVRGDRTVENMMGTARFCKKCKHIDCLHAAQSIVEVAKRVTDFYDELALIALCQRCSKRVLLSRSSHAHPTQESRDLIDEVAQQLGKPPVFAERSQSLVEGLDLDLDGKRASFSGGAGGATRPSNYSQPVGHGSNYTGPVSGNVMVNQQYGAVWSCEFPCQVSYILQQQGQAAAEWFIRQCLTTLEFDPNVLDPTVVGFTFVDIT